MVANLEYSQSISARAYNYVTSRVVGRSRSVTGIALHVFALSPGAPYLAGFESPKVLKGSHKTGSMRASFYNCVPCPDTLQIQKCIFWEALCVKMHNFCINAIPDL